MVVKAKHVEQNISSLWSFRQEQNGGWLIAIIGCSEIEVILIQNIRCFHMLYAYGSLQCVTCKKNTVDKANTS